MINHKGIEDEGSSAPIADIDFLAEEQPCRATVRKVPQLNACWHKYYFSVGDYIMNFTNGERYYVYEDGGNPFRKTYTVPYEGTVYIKNRNDPSHVGEFVCILMKKMRWKNLSN